MANSACFKKVSNAWSHRTNPFGEMKLGLIVFVPMLLICTFSLTWICLSDSRINHPLLLDWSFGSLPWHINKLKTVFILSCRCFSISGLFWEVYCHLNCATCGRVEMLSLCIYLGTRGTRARLHVPLLLLSHWVKLATLNTTYLPTYFLKNKTFSGTVYFRLLS